MQLSNIFIFAGVFRGSMVFGSAPSGSLALRYDQRNLMVKAIITALCFIAACLQVQAEDIGYIRTVKVNRSNQKEYGISISQESAVWPKSVLVFSIACPSERTNQKFMNIGVDLIKKRDEYYFRTGITTFTKNGIENGSFQIDESKIKNCKLVIVYRDDKGVNVIYLINLESYLE